MTGSLDLPEITLGTTLGGGSGERLYKEPERSMLLADTPENPAFVSYFSATATHHEPWEVGGVIDLIGLAETPVLTQEVARRALKWRSNQSETQQEEGLRSSNRVIDDRVTLLARKYVAKEKFSEENNARLAILTERVRQLVPAVTTRELEAVENLLTLVKDVDTEDQVVRTRLGIKKKKR